MDVVKEDVQRVGVTEEGVEASGGDGHFSNVCK